MLKIIEKWLDSRLVLLFLLYTLAFAFPFGYIITPKIIYLWIVLSVIFFIRNYATFSKQDIRSFIRHSIWFFLITLFFLISVFYSKNVLYALDSLWQKLLLVLIPFALFVTCKLNQQFSFEKTLKFFVFGNVAAIMVCLFIALAKSVSFYNWQFVFDIYLPGEHLDINSARPNHFTYLNFSNFMHPSYFSLYVVFSIAILLFKGEKIFQGFRAKLYIKIISLILLISGVFLISSRAGIISLTFLIFLYILYLKGRYFNFLKIGLGILMVITLYFTYTTARFHYIVLPFMEFKAITDHFKTGDVKSINDITGNSRIGIWYSGVVLAEENFPFGVGIGDIRDDLQEKYKTLGLEKDAEDKSNAHNQFLEIFLQAGVLGFVALILLFTEGFYLAFKEKSVLFGFLLFAILFNFMVESMLSRLFGISFFVFFFFLFQTQTRKGDCYNLEKEI